MRGVIGLLAAVCCGFLLLVSSAAAQSVPRTAFVHLFEWQWADVASECENYLGPLGYAGVQVSPPQKSIDGDAWWTRYQPLAYSVEGRSGDFAAFADMVARCSAVGVDIYVDAVINHMAALDRNYPEVPYGPNDFHNCTTGIDYSDRWQVQNCDLVGLNDLATESEYVRNKIAEYLNSLTAVGVAGFRLDAAKHIPANDVAAIVDRLDGNPYIYSEVIGAGGEPVTPFEYIGSGDVTEFNFTNTVGHYFKGRAPLREISNIGLWDGWLDSADAITFVANHDNQRQNTFNTITHKDGGNLNNLAHVFTLGWPYGYPKVMSSYDWTDHDQGPPSSGAGACDNGWLCEHRDRAIANMVAFRNNTAAAFFVSEYWDNGNNQLAWSRGGLGFVVINREDSVELNQTLATGMPAGVYCDIVHGDFIYATGQCTGPTVAVDGNGNANFSVGSRDAVAIHVGAIAGVPCSDCGGNPAGVGGPGGNGVDIDFTCTDATTIMGQSVYVAGNLAELGNWSTAGAVKLEPTDYPTWTGTVNLPGDTDVEWKCLKRNEQDPNLGVEWQPGDNHAFNTGSDTSPSASFINGSNSAPPASGLVDIAFSCANGITYPGQSVYAVGNVPSLGNWDPAAAAVLNPAAYPVWSATVAVPADTQVEWKCVKREEANPAAGVEWQGGSNNGVYSGDGGGLPPSSSGSF